MLHSKGGELNMLKSQYKFTTFPHYETIYKKEKTVCKFKVENASTKRNSEKQCRFEKQCHFER